MTNVDVFGILFLKSGPRKMIDQRFAVDDVENRPYVDLWMSAISTTALLKQVYGTGPTVGKALIWVDLGD